MKAKKYWILVIVSLSILIVVWPAQRITGETGLSAKEKENGRNLTAVQELAMSTESVFANHKEVLEGLEGVSVKVGGIKPEVEKYGLTTKDLQTDTELQLRQNGIKVLDAQEWLFTPAWPTLYINMRVGEIHVANVLTVEIGAQFEEKVVLLRKPTRYCSGACTWQRNIVVIVGLSGIKHIREDVKDLVNEFINDYLAVNPKEKATKKKGSVFDDFKPKDN